MVKAKVDVKFSVTKIQIIIEFIRKIKDFDSKKWFRNRKEE